MQKNKNVFQMGLSVLKVNISRAISIILFLFAAYLLFVVIEQLAYTLFQLDFLDSNGNVVISWFTVGVTSVICVLMFLILAPLGMGIKKWFYLICSEEQMEFTVAFEYFSSFHKYGSCLLLKLNLWLRKIGWTVLFLLPGFLLKMILDIPFQKQNLVIGTLYGMIYVLVFAAMILGAVSAFYVTLKYFLVEYLYFEQPDSKIKEMVKCSVDIMQSRRGQLIKIYALLIPFYILSILILPLILLIPYQYIINSLQGRKFLKLIELKEV